MRVRVIDDINVKIVDDPDHDQKFKDHYILWPNSARRDIVMDFALPNGVTPRPGPFAGKDL